MMSLGVQKVASASSVSPKDLILVEELRHLGYHAQHEHDLFRTNSGTETSSSSIYTRGIQAVLQNNALSDRPRHRQHYDPTWDWKRIKAAQISSNRKMELALLIVIILNMGMTVVDTNARAAGEVVDWARAVNGVILAIYLIEISVRIYAQRLGFFHSKMNIVDAAVIIVDIVGGLLGDAMSDIPAVSTLRIFRIVRFLRAGHFVVFFPELYWIVRGMFSAFKALFWGIILILIMLLMWAIVAVEVVNDLNQDLAKTGVYGDCERCGRAFQDVGAAMLTFFQQVLAGDSWGRITVPMTEAHPWTTVVFMGAFFTVNLGALNLILAVIVDRAQQAHADDVQQVLKLKTTQFEHAKINLYRLCMAMDKDNDGSLTIRELNEGYENNKDFGDTMKAMDISKEDMTVVFNIMDRDKSGEIDYTEFVEQLYKMKSSDAHTLLVFIKHYVTEVRHHVMHQLRLLKDFVEDQDAKNTAKIDAIAATLPLASHTLSRIFAEAHNHDMESQLRADGVAGEPVDNEKPSVNNGAPSSLPECERESRSQLKQLKTFGSDLPPNEGAMTAEQITILRNFAQSSDSQGRECSANENARYERKPITPSAAVSMNASSWQVKTLKRVQIHHDGKYRSSSDE